MNIVQILQKRKTRVPRFDYCNFDGEKKSWSWMIFDCRTWTEVEQVLNSNSIDWNKASRKITGDGWEIVKI